MGEVIRIGTLFEPFNSDMLNIHVGTTHKNECYLRLVRYTSHSALPIRCGEVAFTSRTSLSVVKKLIRLISGNETYMTAFLDKFSRSSLGLDSWNTREHIRVEFGSWTGVAHSVTGTLFVHKEQANDLIRLIVKAITR